jgi:hypothetical protein
MLNFISILSIAIPISDLFIMCSTWGICQKYTYWFSSMHFCFLQICELYDFFPLVSVV